MKAKSRRRHIGLYCLFGLLACSLTIACKLAIVWGVDSYIYSLPIAGGVLASLEVVEIASPILIALLGLALGALTYYLPTGLNLGIRLLLLILAFPLILLLGYKVRHSLWINRVATQERVSFEQAQQVTDTFLEQETSKKGSVGFYWYTVTRATPPIRLSNLETTNDINSLQKQLTDVGSRQTGGLGLAFRFYHWLFSHAGWGIRAVYALLSGFVGLSYFYKGQNWAVRQRRR
ncbi:hypothetical protein IQ260_18475 [Leptolyngbya cf. ectocarpi LEGE 11479]|uniref:Uncharacterized protein n=1 Tax=Leptolyngbya cf. ectocarpi LEGE 11479 TaxID=1828722 RepID=A0A929FB15_LEPEC|nr:hypothetical protein [Leptolyngbya ectocarpi]MBE9068634.1 hypothetical protein [Leptolyngbya cf. ectocarpi LEGE 11479]